MNRPKPNLRRSEPSAGIVAPLIHKWFARRRPEAIRRVLDGLSNSGDTRKLRIMDPFAGSGMILLECLMDGHDVFGLDVNPVAWLIARQTLSPPSDEQILTSFQEIDKCVGDRIRGLFMTETPSGLPAEFVTGFYVRVAQTRRDGEFELHHNYLIARDRSKNWAVYYCPNCGAVFSGECSEAVQCNECDSNFNWNEGTVSKGKVKIDNRELRLSEFYKQEVCTPEFKLIAVESYSERDGRQFHKPSALDYENVDSAKSQCLEQETASRISSTLIPADRRDARPISHGFTHYGQLFAPRQLLSLSLIADAIRELQEPELRYAMALALSDAAGSNNRMCRYAADWLKLTPAFGFHGFDVVTRPVEGNVWGASRGRGSFRNCVRKANRAYRKISSSINEVAAERNSSPIRDVRCLPSQDLSEVKWDEMDAIVTDPPYFDNLDYGELSDFYFQWLRVALNNEPPFDRVHSLSDSDLSKIAASHKYAAQFSSELAKILEQALANLKPDGVVAFSYHHAKSQAWECLADALKKSGIAPYRVMFVRSELENGFHSSTGNIKTDAIFYCRKRSTTNDVRQDNLIEGALGSLFDIENLKSIDITSAGYAMATALSALDPSRNFQDLLAHVRQVAEWN